ncbi:MAG: 3-hydroxyacyl-CoA dehydrogenase NAD-binding domain-containing protein [Arthrobacter sp.]|uniref:3-hydroxyacyl-CoA dehydrogenase NAD-binding domain-containing protein n=1 Tax=unclassified Arthrobacter TaxID=235627 RepID=UPI0026538CC8|nr:3-hydroxyacyl-CoA dehydrogenase NAD-binding domain-containing protein [Micrococcaceae bacterium]MDN5824882.1 3-hydroxyacyl-CoA dehydrogenase NAD-binding domain-containing protein [Micrococcaceae bacterium]MDN5879290.1 3-hydroxyacyl-CoA dehydrogenase NAD-binding domain-containing protein [Micrococcaceae bacterium]MDN5886671.1 3-hydroxyacyl-CoA dehydrogenase NAD-binding domain-containing protein [Micrococcaceae bacterium]MDN5905439.1 3-hydroxyacyl-CoA dehydrogenase NAD-binding domain-containin
MSNYPNLHDVETVACVGIGTIGGGWAAYFLSRGFRVQAWDPSADAGDKLAALIDAAWPALTQLGLAPNASKDNWSVHAELADAVSGVGFVQESAPEDLDLKSDLLARIDAVTDTDVVIGSSTSGYGMSEMNQRAAHPERLVVGHPFNPPYLIPLVEVAGAEGTDPAAVAWASQWYDFIGKSVITMDREVPGFIANRLQEALWREALHMIDNGEATVEQIDLAITDGPGLRWPIQGPMLTFHLAGGPGGMAHMLDHFGPSLKSPWTRLDAPELTRKLRDDVIAGCDEEAGERGFADLVAERDAAIIAVRTVIGELKAAPKAAV